MRALGGLAGGVLLVLALPACGTRTAPDPAAEASASDPASSTAVASASPTVAKATRSEWVAWAPTFGDVRPASADDIAEFTDVLGEKQLTEWTMVDTLTGIEIAYTPTRVRLRQDLPGLGPVELHVDPSREGDTVIVPSVLCMDGTCTYQGDETADREGTDVEYTDLDDLYSTAFYTAAIRRQQPPSPGYVAARTQVASPGGPLDCLVVSDEEWRVDQSSLRGEPVLIGIEEAFDTGEPYVPACLDAQGSLVVTGNVLHPVVAAADWRPGVDADITAYPFEVRWLDEAVDPGGLRG